MFIPLSVAVSLISFGALVAFSFVNLAVIIHYLVLKKERGVWAFIRYGLLPALGLVYVAILWANLQQMSLIGGLAWAASGLIYALILWRVRGIDPFAALAVTSDAEDAKA